MTIHEFITDQEELIREFFLSWREGMQTDPGVFPAEMEASDWEEQFQLWKQNQP